MFCSVNKHVINYCFSCRIWCTIFKRNICIIADLARRLPNDIPAMSLDTSQWRHSDVSNETPNDVSVVRRQDVSLVKDVLEEYRGDFLQKGNYEVTLLRPYDVKQVLNKTPNEVSKIRPKNVLLVSQSTKIYLGTTIRKINK